MSAGGSAAARPVPAGFEPILAFLQSSGLAGRNHVPVAEPLTGGVSSDIWKVALEGRTVCVKRALARLRVAQVWEAPVGRNRYERLWMEAASGLVPGITPRVLAWDDAGVFAMEYLDPAGHPLWKAELAAGRADIAFAAQVGRALARIHAGTANRPEVAEQFRTDEGFHAIRLEPYLVATGRAHPALAARLDALVATTAGTRLALVHGDVSPKNILIGPDGPVILDAECAWYGDPAFDVAFCLNHLLLKCLWVPGTAPAFLASFDAFSDTYLAGVDWEPREAIESRAAALLPGLLLARVDGKSPAEYLTTDRQKDIVRRAATALLRHPAQRLAAVRDAFDKERNQ